MATFRMTVNAAATATAEYIIEADSEEDAMDEAEERMSTDKESFPGDGWEVVDVFQTDGSDDEEDDEEEEE